MAVAVGCRRSAASKLSIALSRSRRLRSELRRALVRRLGRLVKAVRVERHRVAAPTLAIVGLRQHRGVTRADLLRYRRLDAVETRLHDRRSRCATGAHHQHGRADEERGTRMRRAERRDARPAPQAAWWTHGFSSS